MIPSPYYFVPFFPKVFRPEWAPFVSHDVPFKGSLSGTLEIEITTKRPLFIRGAAEKPEKVIDKVLKNQGLSAEETKALDAYLTTALMDGKPFIPGASLRGAVRNVMKIASCGSLKETIDSKFSVRDLRSQSYKNHLVRNQGTDIHSRSQAGFLKKDGERWQLTTCKMARVEQRDLAAFRGIHHRTFEKAETAKQKRDLWEPKAFQQTWSVEAEYQRPLSKQPHLKLRYSKTSPNSKTGTAKTGTLVLTGQAGRKHMEYFFYDRSANPINLTDQEIASFLDVHASSDAWEEDYRPRFERGEEIPIFYLEDQNNHHFKVLGLTSMMRYPTEKSVHDGLTAEHTVKSPDLVDTVLGAVADEKAQSNTLGTRVSFGSLTATRAVDLLSERYLPSGGPKPSFFPNYLKQKAGGNDGERVGNGQLNDWNSHEVTLAGWKRYAVYPDSGEEKADLPVTPPDLTAKFATGFRACPSEVVFKGRVDYHNLLPVELGALVWALTLGSEDGETTGDRRHVIGAFKPYGLGSMSLRLTEQSSDCETFPMAINAFQEKMAAFCGSSGLWEECVRELLAISTPRQESPELLKYPTMEMGGQNEFVDAKTENSFLPQYSVRFLGKDAIDFEGGVIEQEIGAHEVEVANEIADGAMMHVLIVPGRRGKKQCQIEGNPIKYGLGPEHKDDAQIGETWLAECQINGHVTTFVLRECLKEAAQQ